MSDLERASQALLTDDAAGIAARVVAGELSAEALLDASLQRIDDLDSRLGAVCLLAPQPAREAARAIDREVHAVAGRPAEQQALLQRRPFAGVPFLLKDLGVAGADVGAAHAAPAVSASRLRRLAGDAAARVPPSRRAPVPLRIGFIDTRFEGSPIDPRIAAAVGRVAEVLEESGGHRLEPARIPVATDDVVETVIRTMACWTAAAVDAFCRSRSIDPQALPEDALEPSTWGALRLGRRSTASDYIGLIERTNRIARAVGTAVEGFDVVVLPVLAEPPAEIGRFAMNNPDYLDYRLGADGLGHYSPFTPLANLTGQPAVSLPLATIDGLPVGIQLIGRMGADAELLALCADLEERMPWRDRKPGALTSVQEPAARRPPGEQGTGMGGG